MLRSNFLRIIHSPVVNQCRYLPRKPRVSNPGIDGRVQMLREEKLSTIEPEDVEEDLESDFMDVGEMHKKYKDEERWHKEKVAYWITRDKYFKQRQPNFLTWSEKEQIRFLSRDSPSEWTAEKLAESFPADELTIRKILKSSWLPADEQRILKHDKHVQENWEAFRRGEVGNLSEELTEHLRKFAHRKFDPAATPKVHLENTRESALKLPVGEFTEILTSCKAYGQIEGRLTEKETQKTLEDGQNSKERSSMFRNRRVTLAELKKSDGNCEEVSQPKSENSPAIALSGDEMQIFNVKKFNSSPVTQQREPSRRQQDIRERIYIPKRLWRRGGTYKLDDCFYDDDGEFLYRVPGMTGGE